MKLATYPKQIISSLGKRLDPFSLQFRLTMGMVVLSIFGLGSVALWTCWKMQQILIDTHKQNLTYVADRFPQDMEVYGKLLASPIEGLQPAIDSVATEDLLIWVKHPEDGIIAKSKGVDASILMAESLMLLPTMPARVEGYQIKSRYLLFCASPLVVQGKSLGRVYFAQDITRDQSMLNASMRSLAVVSLLVIMGMMVGASYYIHQSLKPLRHMSQLAGEISSEDLGQARLKLDHSPTEVQDLADTCDMMLTRLSMAWEQQRQFVSNVSHELRTPLTVVHGYIQSLLRRSSNLTETQREALEVAANETELTIRLLQDLLDLARADNGDGHFRWEVLAFNDVVGEVLSMAEQVTGNSRIYLEKTSERVMIRVDRDRLKQVLLNLIDNAMKYSESDQPITVKLDQCDDRAVIQVIDRGQGIALQHQSRIFERFYRVDEARARSTGGYGLGLAIVKTLVEGMGGSVTVRSKLGEGSTFTIVLPARS